MREREREERIGSRVGEGRDRERKEEERRKTKQKMKRKREKKRKNKGRRGRTATVLNPKQEPPGWLTGHDCLTWATCQPAPVTELGCTRPDRPGLPHGALSLTGSKEKLASRNTISILLPEERVDSGDKTEKHALLKCPG